jgi:hypothetical protein
MLKALDDAGVHVNAAVLDRSKRALRESTRRLRRYLRRGGFKETTRRIMRRVRRRIAALRGKQRPASTYRAYADTVHEIDDPNSDAGVELLKGLAPDIVV